KVGGSRRGRGAAAEKKRASAAGKAPSARAAADAKDRQAARAARRRMRDPPRIHYNGSVRPLLLLLSAQLVCAAAAAQHEGHGGAPDQDELRLPHARVGSGTSWQPDDTPVEGVHAQLAGFMVMLHGAASVGWD